MSLRKTQGLVIQNYLAYIILISANYITNVPMWVVGINYYFYLHNFILTLSITTLCAVEAPFK